MLTLLHGIPSIVSQEDTRAPFKWTEAATAALRAAALKHGRRAPHLVLQQELADAGFRVELDKIGNKLDVELRSGRLEYPNQGVSILQLVTCGCGWATRN
jgi:hypothetical protein